MSIDIEAFFGNVVTRNPHIDIHIARGEPLVILVTRTFDRAPGRIERTRLDGPQPGESPAMWHQRFWDSVFAAHYERMPNA